MRNFYNSQKKVNQAGINTANNFTWTNSAKKIIDVLKGGS